MGRYALRYACKTVPLLLLFVIHSSATKYFSCQVMVFVHARNATVKTAMALREIANNSGDSKLFRADQDPQYGAAEKQVTDVIIIMSGRVTFLLFCASNL